jgi:hypothetical protein
MNASTSKPHKWPFTRLPMDGTGSTQGNKLTRAAQNPTMPAVTTASGFITATTNVSMPATPKDSFQPALLRQQCVNLRHVPAARREQQRHTRRRAMAVLMNVPWLKNPFPIASRFIV